MTVSLPSRGTENWDVPLNAALTGLDERITAIESNLWADIPLSADANGTPGQMAFDQTGHLYVCIAVNTWVRVTLAAW